MDSSTPTPPSKKPADGKRLRILLSCYSCGPDRGSEPGVGWNAALALAEFHEVHVLTTSEFQKAIEARIQAGDLPEGLFFHFFEIPLGQWIWRHANGLFIRMHYMLWQRMASAKVRKLHRELHFDSAQHLTFVRYWSPSCLANSGIPYILGPVGGAEYTPPQFLKHYSFKGKVFETIRNMARRLGELNSGVRKSLRNAQLVLATTQLTAERCVKLGVDPGKVIVCGESALSASEFERLAKMEMPEPPLCFFGLGRLVPLKGYDLALRAFAKAAIPDSRFLLIGGGQEEGRLKTLAKSLGIADRLEITGFVPRDQALALLGRTHVMVHPSHHDSGGWACIEAMAAGKPVVCLDWGGPATQVAPDAGFKIPIGDEDSVVQGMADAMCRLSDKTLRHAKGEAAKHHVRENYLWSAKAAYYSGLLRQVVNKGACHAQ